MSNDPNNHDGTTSYLYDAVGNRQQLLVNGTMANTYSYDADDRLGSDSYDADGNTINSLGIGNVYDFENHMITHGTVAMVYDGDGNRVSETVGGVTTSYLVDTQNPTGYAQVVDELQSGTVTRTYSFGLERISETQTLNSVLTTSFYGYDGHGSVRQLTNSAGTVTDTYDYDAFGNLINQTGSTPNNYLFAGEQYDPALGLYYNRARYLSQTTGRFWSMDPASGDAMSPMSLHRYLYADADPVDGNDPTGLQANLGELSVAMAVGSTISAMSNVAVTGVYSALFNGLPDALGFGVFFSRHLLGFPAILGWEVVFSTRFQAAITYAFGGAEPSIPWGHHGIEIGVFAAWYWNLDQLSAVDVFKLAGASYGGGFIAPETAGNTTSLLFGMSNDLDPSLFGIAGVSGPVPYSQVSLSESAMISEASAAEAAFTAGGLIYGGFGVTNVGGLAAVVINAGAVATWVHYNYGKEN